MALIRCPECGKEISDRAVSCPNCGCPIADAPINGCIHFNWADRKGQSIRKTRVVVDGNEYGFMQCEDFLDVPVSGGSHKVELSQGKHVLISETVDISANKQEEFFAFKETMGFSHAQLKRTDGDFSKRTIAKNVPRCPTCGSDKIKKISTTRKVLAFEMVGFASHTIGKTFECRKCGYKW